MSLFSNRPITLTLESGEFDCPACSAPEIFWHRSIRGFFAVGPVPLIPLARLGEYVECQQCGHRYAIEILGDDPGPRHAWERAEFAQHVAWVMILAAVEAGPLLDAQALVIADVFAKLAGGSASPEGIRVRDGADLAIRAKVEPAAYIQRFREVFREAGRIDVLLSAVERVMQAGGQDSDSAAALMDPIRSAVAAQEPASV
ncbi:MAG: hypothetical protein U0800_11555 [Isosphaeraceae bacterium]